MKLDKLLFDKDEFLEFGQRNVGSKVAKLGKTSSQRWKIACIS